jgi:D-arabinose 1-dehydrogenase-like Zn-dependent alcohol dehydrogenase
VSAEDDNELSRGNHVIVDYVEPCGSCLFCRDGRVNLCPSRGDMGFRSGGSQQYVLAPRRSLHHVPHDVPFDQAALLRCAVVRPYHALKISGVSLGDSVCVFRVGGAGIYAIQLSKLLGCRTIAVDASEDRLDVAKGAGVT